MNSHNSPHEPNFHLATATNAPDTLDKMFDRLRYWGYPLTWISYERWRDELSYQEENPLWSLVPFFHLEAFSGDQKFEFPHLGCRNTIEGLAGTDIVCPSIDAKLLDIYFSYLPGPV